MFHLLQEFDVEIYDRSDLFYFLKEHIPFLEEDDSFLRIPNTKFYLYVGEQFFLFFYFEEEELCIIELTNIISELPQDIITDFLMYLNIFNKYENPDVYQKLRTFKI